MSHTPIIIIGAGGHAKVIADALICSDNIVVGFVDKNNDRKGQKVCGLPILGDEGILETLDRNDVKLIVGIGSSGDLHSLELRRQISNRLRQRGWAVTGVRHPVSTISRHATLATDAQVMAGAVVQAGAQIGSGVILNTNVIVEHDSTVGAYSHISVGAILCGEVQIGSCSHIGAGAVLRQGISLGDNTTVGIGAIVTRDHEGGVTLIGNPAKEMIRK